jgi:hypothetical protein
MDGRGNGDNRHNGDADVPVGSGIEDGLCSHDDSGQCLI